MCALRQAVRTTVASLLAKCYDLDIEGDPVNSLARARSYLKMKHYLYAINRQVCNVLVSEYSMLLSVEQTGLPDPQKPYSHIMFAAVLSAYVFTKRQRFRRGNMHAFTLNHNGKICSHMPAGLLALVATAVCTLFPCACIPHMYLLRLIHACATSSMASFRMANSSRDAWSSLRTILTRYMMSLPRV